MEKIVLHTKRLDIVAKSLSEMQEFYDKETDLDMKQAYSEMIQGMIDDPLNAIWFSDWSVYLKDTDIVIGGMAYKGKANQSGEVEIGYGFDDAYQKKGYAYETLCEIVKWAFSHKKVKRVMAETVADNEDSQKLLMKVGFRPTGIIGLEGPRFMRDMKYEYSKEVRTNDAIRDSFNALTRKVFCFDFEGWYAGGCWTERYEPHVLLDKDKVIANVSVNHMQFLMDGEVKKFIQLGTVMTDPDYRGQGLGRFLMEQVLLEYKGKVDGIYLFGNDSVLDYYPKYGFKEIKEYEYSLKLNKQQMKNTSNYEVVKCGFSDPDVYKKFYEMTQNMQNPNENVMMLDNLGLYQFWLADEFCDNVYYIPSIDTYTIACIEENVLSIVQIVGNVIIDLYKLVAGFQSLTGEQINKIQLHFTPADKDKFEVSLHKIEDCTLFVIGEDLEKLESEKMMIPEISHA